MNMRKVGRYEILAEIGHGGQSVAFKARDPKIDRVVAIKQIRSSEGLSPRMRDEFYARFMREAQAAGRLSHPNIATIYDVGGDEEGEPYIAMEFIDGMNLDDLLEQENPLAPDRVIPIFAQLCSALDYAHECGIVHRDIKPGNIMLTRGGQVKVVDFGIAKVTASSLTQAGTIMGTPSYMSPEQIMGKSVDHRSDIFAVGVVLYEALTGEKPFVGDNPTTIIFKIVNEPHQPVHQRRPTLVVGFDAILDRALAKDPAARYPRCHGLAEDLRQLISIHGTRSMTVPGISSAPTAMFPVPELESELRRKPAAVAGSTGAAQTRIPQPASPERQDARSTVVGKARQSAAPPAGFREATAAKSAGAGRNAASRSWILAAAGLLLALVAAGAYFWSGPGRTQELPAAQTSATALPSATTPAAIPPASASATGADTAGAVKSSEPTAAARAVKPPATSAEAPPAKPPVDASAAAAGALPQTAAELFSQGKSLEGRKDLAAAIENYKRACEMEPGNATYVIRLALAFEKNRSYKSAAATLQKAILLGGDSEQSVTMLKDRLAGVQRLASLAGLLPYKAQVRHDHVIGKGCDGRLTITDAGIRFEPDKPSDHAMQAPLIAIKSFSIKKNRLEVNLVTNKKSSFDVPDPVPVQKIAEAMK